MDVQVSTIKIMPNIYHYSHILVFTNFQNVYKIENKNFSTQLQILANIEFETDEKPIYFCGTNFYAGYLICVFNNGKLAKIAMSTYKTDYKRKKLVNAFNNESPLVFIELIEDDIDLFLKSDILKVTLFNTKLINPVGSKTAKGVQAMKSKHDSKIIAVKKMEQVKVQDENYYRKGLNVVGFYLKDGDMV